MNYIDDDINVKSYNMLAPKLALEEVENHETQKDVNPAGVTAPFQSRRSWAVRAFPQQAILEPTDQRWDKHIFSFVALSLESQCADQSQVAPITLANALHLDCVKFFCLLYS